MRSLFRLFGTVFLLTALLSACSTDRSYDDAIEKNKDRIEDPQRLRDALFLVEVRSITMLHERMLQLAADSGYASALVALAKNAIEYNRKLGEDIKNMAKAEKMWLSTELHEQHQNLLKELEEADRKMFDRNFIRILKTTNEQLNSSFTAMATDAGDPDIRAFSARRLGPLRDFDQQIEQVKNELLITY